MPNTFEDVEDFVTFLMDNRSIAELTDFFLQNPLALQAAQRWFVFTTGDDDGPLDEICDSCGNQDVDSKTGICSGCGHDQSEDAEVRCSRCLSVAEFRTKTSSGDRQYRCYACGDFWISED